MIPLKRNTDKALEDAPSVEHVVVVQRRPGAAGDEAFAEMQEGRDHWWHRLMRDAPRGLRARAQMDAEDVLFILYTSGTTGKPKGIVHTTGGYLTGVTATTKMVFDLKRRGRLLVHRRHRLGDRTFVPRLRPARQRRDLRDVRGRARLAREGSLLGYLRAARRDDSLHGADGDPRVHEVGRRSFPREHDLSRFAC